MPIEFHRDGPWELPDGWVWARLGDLGRWTGGGTPSKSNQAFWMGGTIPWISPKDMKSEIVGDTEDWITENAVANSSTKRVPADSILMVVRSGILNHTFPVAVCDREVTLNQDMRALTPREGIDSLYLANILRRLQRHILYECSKDGTTVASVEPGQLENIFVPIAPSAEQRRIVARIDELFTEIGDGETSLTRARDDLDTWRRALLKAAVTGELTREWRESNHVNEPAENVLRALRGTRLNLKTGGRNDEPKPTSTTNLPELPDMWSWTYLEELAETIRNGTSKVPRSDKNKNEILRISSVRPLWVDVSQIRYLDDQQAEEAATFKVETGDLLFTRYNGSADLVGVGAKYADVPRFYPDKLIRVRLKEEARQYVDFIEIAVNTWVSRRHIAANIKTTAGQQGISGESLKATPIPLPPRSEAAAIVRQIRSYDDDIKSEYAAVEGDSSRLRQSMLKAAFEGRLVEHDSRDEPAEQLLARLSETNAAPTPPRRARQKRRTAASAE
jgi:type I restriction enzyme, S subunit